MPPSRKLTAHCPGCRSKNHLRAAFCNQCGTRLKEVQTVRDEEGRTRTKIIVQKRSYLDPGTEQFPGETSAHNYGWSPNHRADGVLDNTIFGTNMQPLPGPFTLPGKNNPWLGY